MLSLLPPMAYTEVLLIENNRQAGFYNPSPLEKAVDERIGNKFWSSFLEATMEEHGLVRRTYGTDFRDRLLIFEYRRFNLFHGRPSTKDTLEAAISSQHPELTPPAIEIPDQDSSELWDKIDAELAREKQILQAARQRIIDRDGNFNRIRSLTDPNFYSDKFMVEQWPEKYSFAIFEPPYPRQELIQPVALDQDGKFEDQRPDFYGHLYVSPTLKAADGSRSYSMSGNLDDVLQISFPRILYNTQRAINIALNPPQVVESAFTDAYASHLMGQDAGFLHSFTGPKYQPELFAQQLEQFIQYLCIPSSK